MAMKAGIGRASLRLNRKLLGLGNIVVPPPAQINMTGAEPRVAISDASYWTRSGGTLSRPDTTYETNLKNSSVNKSIPFPSQQIPVGGLGYVSIKHAAVDQNSPPLFINWDGNAASPSAASPVLPTIWYSNDSVTGSPDDGTWTQDTSFTPFRPSNVSDLAYNSRGQRYFWPTVGARWVQVRFDNTGTAAMLPHICCSSGQWVWVVGMSIIRNQYTNISTINTTRTVYANAVGGGITDPFFFVTARSGANQQAIIDEQVNVVGPSSSLRRFVRGIYANFWINDFAFANTRPYASMAPAVITGVADRANYILSTLKSYNLALAVSDLTYGNYGTGSEPVVNGDFNSPNGNNPWITNVLGSIHRNQLPGSFDNTYDWPIVSQAAAMAQTYDTNMADAVHPNGTGYTAFRTNENASWRLLYGAAPGNSTMVNIANGLGTTPTVAAKARALAVFDMLDVAYPTAIAAANSNRATLRNNINNLIAI